MLCEAKLPQVFHNVCHRAVLITSQIECTSVCLLGPTFGAGFIVIADLRQLGFNVLHGGTAQAPNEQVQRNTAREHSVAMVTFLASGLAASQGGHVAPNDGNIAEALRFLIMFLNFGL